MIRKNDFDLIRCGAAVDAVSEYYNRMVASGKVPLAAIDVIREIRTEMHAALFLRHGLVEDCIDDKVIQLHRRANVKVIK